MASILLIKYSLKTWLHRSSDKGDFILSRFTFTEDDQHFRAVELNGTERNRYHVSQVTIEDRSVTPHVTYGVTQPFTSMTQLSLQLEQLNYPPFQLGNATLLVNPGDITPDIVQDLQSVLNEGNVATGLPIKLTDGGTWTILNDDGTLTWANALSTKMATLDLSGRTEGGAAIFHTPNKPAGDYILATLQDITVVNWPPNTAKGILIPYYEPPNIADAGAQELVALMQAYPSVEVAIIISGPASGPAPLDPDYEAFILTMQDNGAKVLGYVRTTYGTRAEADVNTDILTWAANYGQLDGIFFDEMYYEDDNAEMIEKYQGYKSYALAQGLEFTVGNPGTGISGAWFSANVADVIIVHEDAIPPVESTLDNYDGYQLPPHRAVLVHSQAAWNASDFAMILRHAKWVYVTNDGVDGNAWNTYSSYLEEMFMASGTDVVGPVIDNYKKKPENGGVVYTLSSVLPVVDATEASYIRVSANESGVIKAISVASDNTNVYPGKEYTIKNESEEAITLVHNDTSLTNSWYRKFYFPGGEDIVLAPDECVTVHYSKNRFELVSSNRVSSGEGTGGAQNLQEVTDIGAVTDNEITIPSAYVPEGDGTEAFAKLTPRSFIVGDRGITGLGDADRFFSAFAFPNEENFTVNTSNGTKFDFLLVSPTYFRVMQGDTAEAESVSGEAYTQEIFAGSQSVYLMTGHTADGNVENTQLIVYHDKVVISKFMDDALNRELSLTIDLLTAPRSLAAPDHSGTIATEEWVEDNYGGAGGGTPTLQDVTGAGATTSNNIIVASGSTSTEITPTSVSVGDLGTSWEQYVSFFDSTFGANSIEMHISDTASDEYTSFQQRSYQGRIVSVYQPAGEQYSSEVLIEQAFAMLKSHHTTGSGTTFYKFWVTASGFRFDKSVAGDMKRLNLALDLLTVERTLQAPNENGIIATQAYVDAAVGGGGGGGGTLDSVTDSGATTTNTITVGGVDVPVGDGEAVMARLTPTSLMLGDIGASGAGDWMKYFSVFDPNDADDAMELGYQDTEGFYTLRMAPWGYNVNHHTEEVADVTPLQSLFFSMQDGQIRMGAQSIQSYGTFHNRRVAFIIVPATGFEFKDEVADKKVTLELDNLTADRTLQAPDGSGTIATQEWATATFTGGGGGTLDSVTDSGASTTNTITVGGVGVPEGDGTEANAKLTPRTLLLGDVGTAGAGDWNKYFSAFDPLNNEWAVEAYINDLANGNSIDAIIDPGTFTIYQTTKISASQNWKKSILTQGNKIHFKIEGIGTDTSHTELNITPTGVEVPGTGDNAAKITSTSLAIGDAGAASPSKYMTVFDGDAGWSAEAFEIFNKADDDNYVNLSLNDSYIQLYRVSKAGTDPALDQMIELTAEGVRLHSSSGYDTTWSELKITPTGFKFLKTDGSAMTLNVTGISDNRTLSAPNASGTIATQEYVTTAISTKADLVGGTVPSSQLPSYVDDVLEYANLAALPGTGTTGKIYITLDDNKQYRWSGSAYVQITNGLIASTTDVPEGSNLYFTEGRVRSAVLTGLSTATNAVITAADTVLGALGKLQKQITDLMTSANIITALGYTPAKAYTPQMTISGNVTLDDTYNGAIVKVKATANITVPSTLSTDFSCTFVTFAGYTGTFIEGSGATLTAPSGTTLAASKTATLFKDGSTTTYMLIGDLS